MSYVDGFVIPVAKNKVSAYKKLAAWGDLRADIRGCDGICFHPDGRHAFSANYKTELQRWDLQTGESKAFRPGADVAVAVSPDGRRLLAASTDSPRTISVSSPKRSGR